MFLPLALKTSSVLEEVSEIGGVSPIGKWFRSVSQSCVTCHASRVVHGVSCVRASDVKRSKRVRACESECESEWESLCESGCGCGRLAKIPSLRSASRVPRLAVSPLCPRCAPLRLRQTSDKSFAPVCVPRLEARCVLPTPISLSHAVWFYRYPCN